VAEYAFANIELSFGCTAWNDLSIGDEVRRVKAGRAGGGMMDVGCWMLEPLFDGILSLPIPPTAS
jgi:hypothetical protein